MTPTIRNTIMTCKCTTITLIYIVIMYHKKVIWKLYVISCFAQPLQTFYIRIEITLSD